MPDKSERVSQTSQELGIDLGPSYGSRKQVVAALRVKGVTIPKSTVTSLRSGAYSGTFISERVLAAELLRTNDASFKDELYHAISETGISVRQPQSFYPHRWTSRHFTEAIANSLEGFRQRVPDQTVRRALLAMRTDIIMSTLDQPNPTLDRLFGQSVGNFLKSYLEPSPKSKSPAMQRLIDYVQGSTPTIPGFYALLYLNKHQSFIGTWVPYELEFMQDFYQFRDKRPTLNSLTPFDRMVLESILTNQTRDSVAKAAILRCRIDIDKSAIFVHKSALLYGGFGRPKS